MPTNSKLLQADEIVWDTLFPKLEKVELKTSYEHHCDWGNENLEPNPTSYRFGGIPRYQGQNVKVVCVCKDINQSYYEIGHAFGLWGSGIRSTKKYYSNYIYSNKIKNLIEILHQLLF